MRKIINSTYITLDGVIRDPQEWLSGAADDSAADNAAVDDGAVARIQTELLLDCDAVLMGRRTYEEFAAVWPARSGDAYSDQINSMSKYVVSSTLGAPEWNNTTVISGDVAAEIKRRKDQPGKNIVQYGFGQLAHTLIVHGLLDELRLWVHPFFIGIGSPEDLLYRPGPTTRFSLVDTKPLTSGIVILYYELN